MGQRQPDLPALELWGGIECSCNRVGEEYFDQIERSGHGRRIEDLLLFAELGIRKLRYPLLWERVAPDSLDECHWKWTDQRLSRIRSLGITPIAGLLHHGSGPRYTSLIDSSFAEKLCRYASLVAHRYPWLQYYTPVNEPLTTARFSCLYGHWYPHSADPLSFIRALLAQCRATVMAMQAVREVNPQAQLVQTEDLGKTFSTKPLSYQADFDNARRWLTFDLLLGRVDQAHAMWSYLIGAGIEPSELCWFLEHRCPPDVIGINHYLTSDRFLDHRLERYPHHTHGGNGRDHYADVEAVRVRAEGPAGPRLLLTETWERYGAAIAVTEAHLGCTREEQLRWLKEIWDSANELLHEGLDVRAVTAWSLLGAFDWNSLLTEQRGYYEPGVFDIRSPQPRATALASMLTALAAGKAHPHPVLAVPGWWKRADRFCYPPDGRTPQLLASPKASETLLPCRPLFITGASGTLGSAFARVCQRRGIGYRLLGRQEMDIANPASVKAALQTYQPWAVINAAGFVRVDDAEDDFHRCFRENTRGPEVLAAQCCNVGIRLVTFSSDLVFDGAKTEPYLESDAPAPLNVYGRSKAEAERRVLECFPEALVIRTSAFFGPWDQYNFICGALRSLKQGQPFTAASDAKISPTYVPHLIDAVLDLLIDAENGIWHLANEGEITWADLARQVATETGLDAGLVIAAPTVCLNLRAQRPLYSVLGSEKGPKLLPPLDEALAAYLVLHRNHQ